MQAIDKCNLLLNSKARDYILRNISQLLYYQYYSYSYTNSVYQMCEIRGCDAI